MSHHCLESRDSVSSLNISPLKPDMSSIHEIAEELSRSGSISTPKAELLFDRPGRSDSECGVVNSTDLVSDIRNSLVRNQRNIGNGAGSAFTPIAKRVHSDNQTPVGSVGRSLPAEPVHSEVIAV